MTKVFFRCWSCGKEYDSETIPYQYGYKCDCGGYVISPSGKIQGRWESDKNHGGFGSAWKEFVERWSKFQKDREGYIG